MSSEDGDVVDKVMVVEIESFAVVRCIRKHRRHIYTSQTGTLERGDASRRPLHRWSFSRSFVHLSTPNTSLSTNSHDVLEMPHDGIPAYGTTASGLVQRHGESSPMRCQLRNHHTLFQPTSVERPP